MYIIKCLLSDILNKTTEFHSNTLIEQKINPSLDKPKILGPCWALAQFTCKLDFHLQREKKNHSDIRLEIKCTINVMHLVIPKLSSIKSIPSAKKRLGSLHWRLYHQPSVTPIKVSYCPYSQFQKVTWCLSQEKKEAIRIDIAPKLSAKPLTLFETECEEIKVKEHS